MVPLGRKIWKTPLPHHTQAAQLKIFRRIKKSKESEKKKKSHICDINFLLRFIKALIKQALLMETAVRVGSLEELEEVLRSASEWVLGDHGDAH